MESKGVNKVNRRNKDVTMVAGGIRMERKRVNRVNGGSKGVSNVGEEE